MKIKASWNDAEFNIWGPKLAMGQSMQPPIRWLIFRGLPIPKRMSSASWDWPATIGGLSPTLPPSNQPDPGERKGAGPHHLEPGGSPGVAVTTGGVVLLSIT